MFQDVVTVVFLMKLVVTEILGIIVVFLFLTAAYYLMTSKVTAKASVLFTTTCAFGMLISLLQSIGIIGTMTVEFPVNIDTGLCFPGDLADFPQNIINWDDQRLIILVS